MSNIEKTKKNNNNNIINKNNLESKLKSNPIHDLLIKKKKKITDINKLFSKCNNFSFIKNKKRIKKNILTEDLLPQKNKNKKLTDGNIKTHRKSPTNIYDINSCLIKPETNSDIKKMAEKRIFEYKIHRRIQAEMGNIQINKKRKKKGNRYVLVNTRNFKRNDGFTTEYIFEGKIDTLNQNNSLQNSTSLTMDSNKTFQKKNFIKKIIKPILIINNDYRHKNNNNHCLKSCNLETNQYTSRKKKIYHNRGRNIKTENIFRTQSKIKSVTNFYSQDSSISNIQSYNLKKKSKNLLNSKIKNIDISSKLGQSFDLPKKYDLSSSSNTNIRSYTNLFDDKIQNMTVNIPSKKSTNHNYTVHEKYKNLLIEKPVKKSSNFNLKKVFLYKIQNIFKDNFLQNGNFLRIKNNILIKKANSKPNDLKTLKNKNFFLTTRNSVKKIKIEKYKNKSSEKNKKLIKKNYNLNQIETLPIKESIKIKNPLLNINIKLNNNAKVKLKEYLKKNKAKKYPKNNVIKPKNLSFQSKKIIKMESLSKKGFWQPGRDKANQDNYFILKNVNDNEKYLYMGVCDGHGAYGEEISKFLINNLPQNLNNNIINSKIKYLSFEPINNLSKIIVNSFIQTDKELINNHNINTYLSGSTCVSILFTPRRLISINIGDSRCTLGKFNGEKWLSKDLSRDHKPSEEDEKRRIILSGGRVEKNKDEFGNERGPLRIWAKDEDSPGLAVSRSFGDELAHKIGVITEPEIYEYVFLSEDKFFILGSDGLWEYISSEECVNIVKDYYIKNDIEGAINYLYKESSKRWIMEEDVIDDITLIIVFMN